MPEPQTQTRIYRFKDLFDVEVDPSIGIVEVRETPLLHELEEKHPYLSHDVKRINSDVAYIFVTDSDQGLMIFLLPWHALIYSYYIHTGYTCGYMVPLDELLDAVIVEEGEAASVNGFPALDPKIEKYVCR